MRFVRDAILRTSVSPFISVLHFPVTCPARVTDVGNRERER